MYMYIDDTIDVFKQDIHAFSDSSYIAAEEGGCL